MKTKMIKKMLSCGIAALLTLTWSLGQNSIKTIAASEGPELLITEVVPFSQSGSDDYEFIELYNNSENNIDLDDYRLPSQNFDFTISKLIPPKGTMVICTNSSTSLANFNSFYGSALTQAQYFTIPAVNGVLENSSSQNIILSKDDGAVVIRASYSASDFQVKKSINYAYPRSGFDMGLLSQKQVPTPGTVSLAQIPDNGTSVRGITIDNTILYMDINSNARLYETITPATAANKTVIWTSSNTSIAEVDQNGLITAKAEGIASIKAKTVDGGYEAICTIVVRKVAVTGVTLDKASMTLDVGKAVILTASVNPISASNKALVWRSTHSDIASVDSNGVVIGKKSGITFITVTTVDGNYLATCTVTVNSVNTNISVTGVSLNKQYITIEPGKVIILEAQVKPSSATNRQVTWTTSNSDIATVDQSGIITAKQSGTAVITVKTAEGVYSDRCVVTVTDKVSDNIPVSRIKLNKYIVGIREGKSEKLSAEITPKDASNKMLNWQTNNSKVATVDSNGIVTAVSEGFAIITASSKDGKHSDQCIVIVKEGKSPGNGNGKGKAKGHLKIDWED